MANDSRSENPPRENGPPAAAEPAGLREENARSGEPPESSARLAETAEEIEEAGPKKDRKSVV